MTTLSIYPAAFGEPSASPFCVKAMLMLDHAGFEYESLETADPRNTPYGKLPTLVTPDRTIADSDNIRAFVESHLSMDFDERLTDTQKGASRALIRMIEEHVYFSIVGDRWQNDENWPHIKREFFSEIPFPLNGLITARIRKQAIGNLVGQGIGRLSPSERFARIKHDLVALERILADQAFLFGASPTAADFSAIPFLFAAIAAPVETETSAYIRSNATLMRYMTRGRQALYPTEYGGLALAA